MYGFLFFNPFILSGKSLVLMVAVLLFSNANAINRDSLDHVFFNAQDPNERLHAGLIISQMLMRTNMDSAVVLLEAASALANDKDIVRKADYFNTKGVYYWYMGDLEKAIEQYKVTMSLDNNASGLLSKRSQAANNIGTLYAEFWEHDSARKYLDIALQIDTDLGNKRGMYKSMYDLGRLHLRLDQYELALRYLLEVADFQVEAKDTFRLVHTLGLLGNAYVRLDSTEKALEVRLRIVELASHGNLPRQLANAFNNLASMYAGRADDWEKAISYARQGLVIAEENQYHYVMLALNVNIGIALMTGGAPQEAMAYFLRANDLVPMVRNQSAISRLYLYLGQAYIQLNEYRSARNYLNKSLEIVKGIGSLNVQSDVYFNLATLDSLEGNYLSSMAAFRRGYSLRDSLWSKEHRSRISELQIIYDTERKLFQIEELEKSKRIDRMRFYLGILILLIIIMIHVGAMVFYNKKRKMDKQQLMLYEKEVEKTQLLLAANKQELTGKALSLVKSEQIIQKLRDEVQQMILKAERQSSGDFKPLLKLLKTSERDQQLWKDFENRFNELNDGFITKLVEKCPGLSPAEIRLCAMLRLNLSTKEISEITSRSTRTIETTRSNIRKKLGLSTSDNLINYLLQF